MANQFDLASLGKAALGRQNEATGDKGKEEKLRGTGEKEESRRARVETQPAERAMHSVV